MANFYFPCTHILPPSFTDTVSYDDFSIIPRKLETSVFDIATLTAYHKFNFPSELMQSFLRYVSCEIEVRNAQDFNTAIERVHRLQGMLYLHGVTPFIMPFATNYSINAYSGINSRDSSLNLDKLPEGLRDGIKTQTNKFEAWQHQLTLDCIFRHGHEVVSADAFQLAALFEEKWSEIDANNKKIRPAFAALLSAPLIRDHGSSLLHLWQGIESLFNINAEINFRVSLLTSQLAAPLEERITTYKRAQNGYKVRSRAAHGSDKKVTYEEWIEAWELLCLCIMAVMRRGGLPSHDDLIMEILSDD